MGRAVLVSVIVGLLGCASGVQGNPDSGSGVPRYSEGDPCGGWAFGVGGAQCEAPTRAIQCRSDVFVGVACRGPTGCAETTSGTVLCDNTSGILEGDRCFPSQEGTGQCSDDAGTRFLCADGGYVGIRCDGGCSVAGSTVNCVL